MTTIRWRDYQIGDEESLRESKWVDQYGEYGWENLKQNLRSGNIPIVYTFADDDGLVHGVGGFVPYGPGNAEVFNVINTPALRLIAIPRAVKTCLHQMQMFHGFTRVFATCRADEVDDLDGWFRFLGMKQEALIEAWALDGSDVYFYTRIMRGVT